MINQLKYAVFEAAVLLPDHEEFFRDFLLREPFILARLFQIVPDFLCKFYICMSDSVFLPSD